MAWMSRASARLRRWNSALWLMPGVGGGPGQRDAFELAGACA